jgi:Pilin (bacterial filament)
MNRKAMFFITAIVLLLLVAAFVIFTQVREDRVKAEQAREAAERARDDAKGQLAQVRDERERLDSAKLDAQRQAQSLNEAVDASKQFERAQMEKGKRGQHIAAALAASQQFKVVAAEHHQSTGQWPKNNKEVGLPAPESFRSDILLSAALETHLDTSKVRVRYRDDQAQQKELHLIASVNAAGAFSWQCISPDTQDITEFAPSCKYRAK